MPWPRALSSTRTSCSLPARVEQLVVAARLETSVRVADDRLAGLRVLRSRRGRRGRALRDEQHDAIALQLAGEVPRVPGLGIREVEEPLRIELVMHAYELPRELRGRGEVGLVIARTVNFCSLTAEEDSAFARGRVWRACRAAVRDVRARSRTDRDDRFSGTRCIFAECATGGTHVAK